VVEGRYISQGSEENRGGFMEMLESSGEKRSEAISCMIEDLLQLEHYKGFKCSDYSTSGSRDC